MQRRILEKLVNAYDINVLSIIHSNSKYLILSSCCLFLLITLNGVAGVAYNPQQTDDRDDSITNGTDTSSAMVTDLPTAGSLIDKGESRDGSNNKTRAGSILQKPKENCGLSRTVITSGVTFDVCFDTTKTLLIYEPFDENDLYPPWTYHGFGSPEDWHKVDITLFNMGSNIGGETLSKKYPAKTPAKQKQMKRRRKTGEATTTPEPTESSEPVEHYGFVPSFMRFNGHLSDNYCDGPTPSPIEIDTAKAKVKDTLTEFEYTNMEDSYSIQMYFPEDGTNLLTVRALESWETGKAPCISKGSVTGPDLCLDRFFIRYGTDGKTGSEHRLGNKTFGMEFQFFFTLQKQKTRSASEFFYSYLNDYVKERESFHSNPNQPREQMRGKLVRALAVFVEVNDTKESEPNMHLLAELARLFWDSSNHKKLRAVRTQTKVFRFEPFFPVSVYYTYKGSLTFPPCFPDLDWTVFEKPISISRKDFEKFLFIPSEFDETGYVAGNLRPIESIYVQLEDSRVNKDDDDREKAKTARINREVLKSLPPEDTSKEDFYDYYEDLPSQAAIIFSSVYITIWWLITCFLIMFSIP